MTDTARMKEILREVDYPFFSDPQLDFYVNENNGDVDAAIYQCLLIKSENQSQLAACSGKSPVCLKLKGFRLKVKSL